MPSIKDISKFTLISISLLVLSVSKASSTALDFTAGLNTKAATYNNLNFISDKTDKFYYLQDTYIGFKVKDIPLYSEYSPDTAMDFVLKFHGVGLSGTNTPTQPPFSAIAARYPASNFSLFLENAYVNLSHVLHGKISLKAGKQPFSLASGLALDDDGLGFIGFNLQISEIFKDIGFGAFAFQPQSSQPGQGGIDLFGFSLAFPTQGLWQAYSFWEIDHNTATVNSVTSDKVVRNFTGLAYALNYSTLSFGGEFVLERGKSHSSGNASNIDLKGHAFKLEAKWAPEIGQYGNALAHMSYAMGSGDKASTANTNEAFFPSFGHRYSGLERSGYGDLFGASAYDAWGGVTTTSTGLPTGVSGIHIFNVGAKSPAIFNRFYLDVDYFYYEADQNTTNESKLGAEWDFALSYPLSPSCNIRTVYARFSPGNIYPSGTPSSSKFSLETTARF
jgi:hypothetical protein